MRVNDVVATLLDYRLDATPRGPVTRERTIWNKKWSDGLRHRDGKVFGRGYVYLQSIPAVEAPGYERHVPGDPPRGGAQDLKHAPFDRLHSLFFLPTDSRRRWSSDDLDATMAPR